MSLSIHLSIPCKVLLSSRWILISKRRRPNSWRPAVVYDVNFALLYFQIKLMIFSTGLWSSRTVPNHTSSGRDTVRPQSARSAVSDTGATECGSQHCYGRTEDRVLSPRAHHSTSPGGGIQKVMLQPNGPTAFFHCLAELTSNHNTRQIYKIYSRIVKTLEKGSTYCLGNIISRGVIVDIT